MSHSSRFLPCESRPAPDRSLLPARSSPCRRSDRCSGKVGHMDTSTARSEPKAIICLPARSYACPLHLVQSPCADQVTAGAGNEWSVAGLNRLLVRRAGQKQAFCLREQTPYSEKCASVLSTTASETRPAGLEPATFGFEVLGAAHKALIQNDLKRPLGVKDTVSSRQQLNDK